MIGFDHLRRKPTFVKYIDTHPKNEKSKLRSYAGKKNSLSILY